MSSIDSWWLSFWEWFATIGFILVIAGCIIEGVEHFVKFKRNESKRRRGIEKLGWLILVGGLAMEFLGDKRAKRIADRENRRLTVEAAEARKDASKANDRASSNELQVAALSNETALAQVTLIKLAHQYDLSTNALAEANARLATIRPLKDRLTAFLNEIDPKIILALRSGMTRFNVRLPEQAHTRLKSFHAEQGADAYISGIANLSEANHKIIIGPRGSEFDVVIELNPALAK